MVFSSIAAFAISIPWVNQTLFKTLFKKSSIGNLLSMGYYALITLAASAITWVITEWLPLGENRMEIIGWLFARAGVCLVVPNLIFVLCYGRKQEFAQVMKMVSSRLRRKKAKAGGSKI